MYDLHILFWIFFTVRKWASFDQQNSLNQVRCKSNLSFWKKKQLLFCRNIYVPMWDRPLVKWRFFFIKRKMHSIALVHFALYHIMQPRHAINIEKYMGGIYKERVPVAWFMSNLSECLYGVQCNLKKLEIVGMLVKMRPLVATGQCWLHSCWHSGILRLMTLVLLLASVI